MATPEMHALEQADVISASHLATRSRAKTRDSTGTMAMTRPFLSAKRPTTPERRCTSAFRRALNATGTVENPNASDDTILVSTLKRVNLNGFVPEEISYRVGNHSNTLALFTVVFYCHSCHTGRTLADIRLRTKPSTSSKSRQAHPLCFSEQGVHNRNG